jgi:CBS domain-containing protein
MTKATTVRDVMTPNPRVATPDMSIRTLAALFAENRISGAPVVGANGTLVGVVSRTDLFRRITLGAPDVAPAYLFDLLNDKAPISSQPLPEPLIIVGDFMSDQVVTATADEPIGPVARRMAERHVHRVVVIDAQRKPIGMVTALDLLNYFPV